MYACRPSLCTGWQTKILMQMPKQKFVLRAAMQGRQNMAFRAMDLEIIENYHIFSKISNFAEYWYVCVTRRKQQRPGIDIAKNDKNNGTNKTTTKLTMLLPNSQRTALKHVHLSADTPHISRHSFPMNTEGKPHKHSIQRSSQPKTKWPQQRRK